MKKNFIFKFLISFVFIFQNPTLGEGTIKFVSLSPALTEIMYAIGAEDMLQGVSNSCTYPKEAQNKEKIGDSYFINDEKIIKIKPDYILALDSSEFALNKFKRVGITPICFKYPNIESIHENIIAVGKLTGKEENAIKVVEESERKIAKIRVEKPKKILYLVQSTPMITVGKNSFITDLIKKSGNISITAEVNSYYPTINVEYALKQAPDIIVLSNFTEYKSLEKFFPNTKVVVVPDNINDIINRPGPRIYEAVKFFAEL